ncbi:MAG: DUF4412 domain-containing protein [Bacteroidota bacterium]
MKRNLTFIISLFLVCIFSKPAVAEDIYIEYSTKDKNGRAIDTKIYLKQGDARVDLYIDMSKMKLTTTSLILKNNPDEVTVFNSLTKSYTKTIKPKRKQILTNYSITVIGKEKVGKYNCTRIRVKSKDKSFDVWNTKDLPAFKLPIENGQTNLDKKLADELEKKGISGMVVKTVYFNPGTTTPKLTMELKKYETKPLSASLFKIPSGYTESKGNPYKNMSPEKKNELMKQMMEQLKSKQ